MYSLNSCYLNCLLGKGCLYDGAFSVSGVIEVGIFMDPWIRDNLAERRAG